MLNIWKINPGWVENLKLSDNDGKLEDEFCCLICDTLLFVQLNTCSFNTFAWVNAVSSYHRNAVYKKWKQNGFFFWLSPTLFLWLIFCINTQKLQSHQTKLIKSPRKLQLPRQSLPRRDINVFPNLSTER